MLSRFRKYVTTAAMSASGHLGENPLFLADVGLRVLSLLLLLALWRSVLASRPPVGGLTLERALTYTLVSSAFAGMLAVRTSLQSDLWQGTIATRFLRPMGVLGQYGAEAAGRWVFDLAFVAIPVFAAAPLLGVDPWPASPAAGALFVVSLALAVAVGLALELVFGAVMILLEQNWYAIQLVRDSIVGVVSGAVLPLAVYPWGIGRVLGLLPFASAASAPLRIYTGTGDPVPLLALQAMWAAVLWPAARRLWRAHEQRLVLYGG